MEATRSGAPVAEHGTGAGRRWARPAPAARRPAARAITGWSSPLAPESDGGPARRDPGPAGAAGGARPGPGGGWRSCTRCARPVRGGWATTPISPLWWPMPAGRGAALVLVNPLHACAPTHPGGELAVLPGVAAVQLAAVPAPGTARRVRGGRRAHPCPRRRPRAGRSRARSSSTGMPRGRPSGPPSRRCSPSGSSGPVPNTAPACRISPTWCALAERHGPDWREWPQSLHDPRGPAVARAREELAGRVAFHEWLQHCCADQLADAQLAAVDAGMEIGIVARHRRRRASRRRGRLGPAGRSGQRRQGRRAAGRLQPARTGLAGAALAAGPAAGDRVRARARHGARGPVPRGRAAPRPRDGAVAAVVGAGRSVAGAGHLRRLRRRRHARDRGSGGGTGGRVCWSARIWARSNLP